jgi:hypothetical protein
MPTPSIIIAAIDCHDDKILPDNARLVAAQKPFAPHEHIRDFEKFLVLGLSGWAG